MFGFGNRKKYNAAVDIKVNNEYQIDTQDNPKFPSILKYLEIIDASWNNDASEDECAMQIATLYLCGLFRYGLWDEGCELASRFDRLGLYGVQRGLIRAEVREKCVALVEKTKRGVSEQK